MKQENQKLKILYLKEILSRQTDEEHNLNTSELIKILDKYGIKAERKSIYSDINALIENSILDISQETGRNGGFRVLNREFELAELKMLVDAVQSSRFISKKQCTALIKKLSAFASVYQEKQLSRSVYVYDREEARTDNVFYLIDKLHLAISENSSIKFIYTEMTPSKQRVAKNNGAKYHVSPYALIWQDERYYLVAFDHLSEKIKHYRVDRMKDIALTDQARIGEDSFEKVSLSSYCSNVFEMFRGEEVMVHFRADNSIAGAMFDRFGTQIQTEVFDGYFEFYAKVSVSVRFYGWVFGFAGALKILSPETVVKGYIEQLDTVREKLSEKP